MALAIKIIHFSLTVLALFKDGKVGYKNMFCLSNSKILGLADFFSFIVIIFVFEFNAVILKLESELLSIDDAILFNWFSTFELVESLLRLRNLEKSFRIVRLLLSTRILLSRYNISIKYGDSSHMGLLN